MIFITKYVDVMRFKRINHFILNSNCFKMSNFQVYLFVSICREVSNINLDNIFGLGTFNIIRDTEMEQ